MSEIEPDENRNASEQMTVALEKIRAIWEEECQKNASQILSLKSDLQAAQETINNLAKEVAQQKDELDGLKKIETEKKKSDEALAQVEKKLIDAEGIQLENDRLQKELQSLREAQVPLDNAEELQKKIKETLDLKYKRAGAKRPFQDYIGTVFGIYRQVEGDISSILDKLSQNPDSFSEIQKYIFFENLKLFDITQDEKFDEVQEILPLVIALQLQIRRRFQEKGLVIIAPQDKDDFLDERHEEKNTVVTTLQDLQNKVHHTLRVGYEWDGKVLRKAEVFRYLCS